VKLPVAFCGGSTENCAPVPGAKLATRPVSSRPGRASTSTRTGRVASFAPGTGAQFSVLPPQNATGNFTKIVQRIPVRIAIQAGPEVRRLLIPGMSVHVTVDTRGAKGELERVRQAQEGRR
jgi:multidrug resistance efflux pump